MKHPFLSLCTHLVLGISVSKFKQWNMFRKSIAKFNLNPYWIFHFTTKVIAQNCVILIHGHTNGLKLLNTTKCWAFSFIFLKRCPRKLGLLECLSFRNITREGWQKSVICDGKYTVYVTLLKFLRYLMFFIVPSWCWGYHYDNPLVSVVVSCTQCYIGPFTQLFLLD